MVNGMFKSCESLVSIKIPKLNHSTSVESFSMFEGCKSLKSLDLSDFHFNIGPYSHGCFVGMFEGCENLTSINLSLITSNGADKLNNMLMNCASLTSIDISHFNNFKYYFIFSYVYKL